MREAATLSRQGLLRAGISRQKRWFSSAALILAILSVALASFIGFQARADWPYCISNCHAKDVNVSDVYIDNITQDVNRMHADVYADFAVTAADRYCILVTLDFSTAEGCTNPITVYRQFGDLPQGTYTGPVSYTHLTLPTICSV
mgnify:CR=1 FL=1